MKKQKNINRLRSLHARCAFSYEYSVWGKQNFVVGYFFIVLFFESLLSHRKCYFICFNVKRILVVTLQRNLLCCITNTEWRIPFAFGCNLFFFFLFFIRYLNSFCFSLFCDNAPKKWPNHIKKKSSQRWMDKKADTTENTFTLMKLYSRLFLAIQPTVFAQANSSFCRHRHSHARAFALVQFFSFFELFVWIERKVQQSHNSVMFLNLLYRICCKGL